MSIGNDEKLIARTAASAFGNKPTVTRYWDDPHVNAIDILICQNTPWDHVSSYATIGVYKGDNGFTVDNSLLRVELLGACDASFEFFPNILATCGFNIINSQMSCYPGAIFRNVVKMYYEMSELAHILFVSPFIWDKSPQTVTLDQVKVAWLQVVPISEAESNYAIEHSPQELETLFEQKQINIFDLHRASIL